MTKKHTKRKAATKAQAETFETLRRNTGASDNSTANGHAFEGATKPQGEPASTYAGPQADNDPNASDPSRFNLAFKTGFVLGQKLGHATGHVCQATDDARIFEKYERKLSRAGRKVARLKGALLLQTQANAIVAEALAD